MEIETLQGRLLVAAPRLDDPNFRRTVILLLQHTLDGALGLVLNRPTKALIKDVWSQVSELPCLSEAKLHVGGPVEGPLMAVHGEQALGDAQVIPGLYFTPEPEKIQQLVLDDKGSFKLFVGYSGWGSGQLEQEMQEGSWFTCAATVEHVFVQADDLWEDVFREVGKASVLSKLKIKHVPPDLRMN